MLYRPPWISRMGINHWLISHQLFDGCGMEKSGSVRSTNPKSRIKFDLIDIVRSGLRFAIARRIPLHMDWKPRSERWIICHYAFCRSISWVWHVSSRFVEYLLETPNEERDDKYPVMRKSGYQYSFPLP